MVSYKPFIRWAGGKTALLPEIIPIIHREYRALHAQKKTTRCAYHEPFLGGGAVALSLLSHPGADMDEQRWPWSWQNEKVAPRQGVYLSDVNQGLIYAWTVDTRVIARALTTLRADAAEAGVMPGEELYRWFRDIYNTARVTRGELAACFLWLNANSFNGLWRENRGGKMNTPWGKFVHERELKWVELLEAQALLQAHDASIERRSVWEALDLVQPYDIVYLDPPYVPISKTASFTSYSGYTFGMAAQERLAERVHQLVAEGAVVIMSNSDTPWVREAYGAYELNEVKVARRVAASAASRAKVGELIIVARR